MRFPSRHITKIDIVSTHIEIMLERLYVQYLEKHVVPEILYNLLLFSSLRCGKSIKPPPPRSLKSTHLKFD